MTLRTRYQRSAAVVELLDDLRSRSTNTVIRDVCNACTTLLASPVEHRRAIEPTVLKMLAKAAERRAR